MNQVETVDEELVASFLLENGQAIAGVDESDENLMAIALGASEGKPYCIVRRWSVLDVMVCADTEAALQAQGLRPTVMYAHEVRYDSRIQGARPGAIRSGFELQLEQGRFESKDTVFILAGPGSRKHASVPALLALDRS